MKFNIGANISNREMGITFGAKKEENENDFLNGLNLINPIKEVLSLEADDKEAEDTFDLDDDSEIES